MRYSTSLRTSRKHNILKHPSHAGLISLVTLLVSLAILLLFVNVSTIDPYQLLIGFTASFFRICAAYIFALVFAVLFVIIITAHHSVENLFLPIFDVLQSFPSFALFPILVQALANSPEIVIVSVLIITMIWPILFSIIGGIKNRRQDLEEAATIFGAVGFKRIFSFTLPELLPSIVTGSIVGWGEGWEFIIGAELLVHINAGIGKYLGYLGDTKQTDLLMIGIVILMILLFLVNKYFWLNLLHKTTQYGAE